MSTLFSLVATSWLAVAAATPGWAQHHPGVYTSSQEYLHDQPAHPGAVAALPAAPTYLEVVNAHTHAVHRVPTAKVWGYADAKGKAYRLVDHKVYTIQPQQDGLVTYSRQRAIQHSRTRHVVTEHFYSETLDGPLHELTKRGLRKKQTASN